MATSRLAGCFSRCPEPGRSKTRLIPAVGAEGAARLQEVFLRDTLTRLSSLAETSVVLWVAGDPRHAAIQRATHELPVAISSQEGEGLGDRIECAFARGLESAEKMILVGSDSPTVPLSLLERAYEVLDDQDAVLGPTPDGGYYLIGFRQGRRPQLNGVRWSTTRTLSDTQSAFSHQGLSHSLLPPWYDVDTSADLRILRAHLALEPSHASETALHFDRQASRY